MRRFQEMPAAAPKTKKPTKPLEKFIRPRSMKSKRTDKIMANVEIPLIIFRLLRGLSSFPGFGGLAPRITPIPVVTATAPAAAPTAPGTLAKGLPLPMKTMNFLVKTTLPAASRRLAVTV